MALPRSYLTSAKNLGAILEAMKAAQAPSKFTIKFLESLDFKSTADRLIVGVLKSVGLIGPDGSPTERYFRFLDQTQSAVVLAEGIRDAYRDLFQVNTSAQNMTKTDVMNKMKTLSQGQFSESVIDKMAMTFLELCKLADFKKQASLSDAVLSAQVDERPQSLPTMPQANGATASPPSFGGLNYVIQVVLPETRDPKIYDSIFRSLREHLIG
ncbi:DUF5343 domain-containing protein [Bradyrhizobium sp. RT3a]|uniref:DUF5343 domain-containing protein n=1 Tax=unclassified Bradyrhizobium TaxID=2631580 RepID=UPI003392B0BA